MTNSVAYSLPGIQLTPEEIVTIIANVYQVPFEIIYTPSQKRQIADSRMMCMYFIRELLKISLAKTGFIFHKDHSTCSHACRQIVKLAQSDKETRQKFLIVSKMLNISTEKTNDLLKDFSRN